PTVPFSRTPICPTAPTSSQPSSAPIPERLARHPTPWRFPMPLHDVIVPKAGLEGDAVEVVSVYVAVGDTVAVDTPLCEVEGAKITVDVVADIDGVVAEVLVEEGDEIDAGEPVVRVQAS